MNTTKPKMKLVNPDNPPEPLDDDTRHQIAALVTRQTQASGVLMKVITFAGSQVEDGLKLLPAGTRKQVDAAARRALEHSYHAAARSRTGGHFARIRGDRAHRVMATISGALGGVGGLPTALAELPVATTVIFRAVQDVAAQYGEDPTSPETRIECLRVFGSGGPDIEDDGVDTAFVGARVSLTGPALNKLINTIAPRFAAVLGQKLATQAVPVIGAAAGAGTNYAFTDYYVEMAHVHFGLRRAVRRHGEEQVLSQFHAELAARQVPVNRN